MAFQSTSQWNSAQYTDYLGHSTQLGQDGTRVGRHVNDAVSWSGLQNSMNNSLALSRANGSSDNDYMQVLAGATKADLLRSGNEAFQMLYTSSLRLECSLEAQREIVNTLLTSRGSLQLGSSSYTTPLPTHSEDNLRIPPPPKPLNRDDYPLVAFWTQDEWTSHQDKARRKGEEVGTLDWLTTETGTILTDAEVKELTATATGIFNDAYYNRLDPTTWRLRLPALTEQFCNTMRTKHPVLSLCKGDWKVLLFGSTRFNTWNRYTRAAGFLKRKNPSLVSRLASNTMTNASKKQKLSTPSDDSIMVISDNDEDLNVAAPARKRPIVRVTNLPTPVTAIATASPSHINPSFSVASPAADPDSDPTSVPKRKRPIVRVITNLPTPITTAGTAAAASPTTSNVITPSPAPTTADSDSDLNLIAVPNRKRPMVRVINLPASGIATTPPISSPTAVSDSDIPPCVQAPTTASLPSGPSQTLTIPATSTPQFGILLPTDSDTPNATATGISHSNSESSRLRGDAIDPFADLLIPPPTSITPLSDVGTSSVAAAPEKRKGKQLVPIANCFTARNLYAIDYLEEHPSATTAQFTLAWKDLDQATKKRYEAVKKGKKDAGKIQKNL